MTLASVTTKYENIGTLACRRSSFRFWCYEPEEMQGAEGEKRSKYLMVGMDKLQPGSGIEEHYHEYNAEMPIFDHAYYVISGRIQATTGDIEKIIGADSLIYCPSNIKHSITNIGKGNAKILRIKGSGEGEKTVGAIFTSKKGKVDYWQATTSGDQGK